MITLYDSHCHLNDDAFCDDLDIVVQRAVNNGVKYMLCIGTDVASSIKAIEIANKYNNVYAAVGIHPQDINVEENNDIEKIKDLAKDNKVVAIGEIGLDYHWQKDEQTKVIQKEWFIKQIEIANQLNLPMSIHCRDAVEDCYDVLSSSNPAVPFVLHCFSGSTEMMNKFIKIGAYIGFDGPITYKNAKQPKQNVISCPLDRMLIETDSPYLPPTPHRGQRNEPSYVKIIADEIGILREKPLEEISDQLLRNFLTVFHVEQKL